MAMPMLAMTILILIRFWVLHWGSGLFKLILRSNLLHYTTA